jgi:hypothetical protein
VIISTGEKYKNEQDFSSGSSYGIVLNRTYRSFSSSSAQMFGPKWYSSFDGYSLTKSATCLSSYQFGDPATNTYPCMPDYVILGFPDGSKFQYTRTDPDAPNYLVSNSLAKGALAW